MSIPVEKTLDEVRTEMFDNIEENQKEYSAKGWVPSLINLNKGIFRGLIELWSFGLHQLYLFLSTILKQSFPSSATDLWLDLHCIQVGIERLKETKAAGTIYFIRKNTFGNVNIPAGRVVKTQTDSSGNTYRYITTEDAVLTEGLTEIPVKVIAESPGSKSNVTAGQINEIVTYIAGVDSVENRYDWLISEGSDTEEDEQLRERYFLAWTESDGCTKRAYEAWVRSVPGVQSVIIHDQHPRGQGTIDVVIIGTGGAPTESLISEVTAIIDQNKPINDDVYVSGPTDIPIIIDCIITITGGLIDEIKTAVENSLYAFFSYTEPGHIEIGQDVTEDKLTAIIMNASSHIKSVDFNSPTKDTEIRNSELAVISSISISHTTGEI